MVVRFAKESNGGTWTVNVDGSLAGTIDSNGSQAYAQELIIKLGAQDSYHKISFVPPTGSGYAYLESFEVVRGQYFLISTNTTSGSADVVVASANNLTVGQQVYGTGIPANTTIKAISGTTITLTNNATATGTGVSINYFRPRPGITVNDGSLGGSSVKNFYDTFTGAVTGAVDGIAPATEHAGFDSYLLNQNVATKYDVIFFGWTVNDAGSNTGIDYYAPALARLVASCQANNTQLVLVCEPGGYVSMSTAQGQRHEYFNQIHDLMESYKGQRNVIFVDWNALLYPPDAVTGTLSEWQAHADRWYPYPTILTLTPEATITGDFTHPRTIAHAPLVSVLNQLTAVPSTGMAGVSSWTLPSQQTATKNNPQVGNYLGSIPNADTAIGVIKFANDSFGNPIKFQSIGNSTSPAIFPQATDMLWTSDTCGNYNTAINTDVAASSTSDLWGKYLDMSGGTYYTAITGGTGKKATVTLVVGKGNVSIRPKNNANSAELQCYINGVATTLGAQGCGNLTDDPVTVHVTFTLTDDIPIIFINGKVYAGWVTATDFPVIAPLSVSQISSGYGSPFFLKETIGGWHTVLMDATADLAGATGTATPINRIS